jgi:hypothetical protein
MSRTVRRSRLKPGRRIRDGQPQYVDPHCAHNNACSYCRDNRTHRNRRRAPIQE